MGLASKLAAANANAGANTGGGGAAPPPSQSSYPGQQQPGGGSAYPGQSPSQPSYGGGAQPQGGSSYPGQQQQYGAPPGPPPGGARPPTYGQPSGPPPTGGQSSYGQQSSGSYAPPPGGPSSYGAQGQQGQTQGQYGQQGQTQGQHGQSQGQYGQSPQQQQYQQPGGQYGGQQSYGAPPGAPPKPAQQGQYGAPPTGGSGGSNDPRYIEGILQQCVQEQKIQAFYPPGSLGPLAQKVAQSGVLDRIASEWRMPKEIASDLVKLSLFDTILYIDDSGSMAFEQGGERIDDMKLILNRVAYACSLFDHDGISVRFMNSNVDGDHITDERSASALLQRVRFSGLTPLGTSMDRKILQPLVLGPARAGRLQKPVLIITITDGAPAGEDRYTITKVISNAKRELARTQYGPDAISFQIAQVGEDQKAQAFLAELDNHPEVGELVDVTSSYEMESAEMLAKSGQELTPELWLVKLLLGGIDDSYDEKDEK